MRRPSSHHTAGDPARPHRAVTLAVAAILALVPAEAAFAACEPGMPCTPPGPLAQPAHPAPPPPPHPALQQQEEQRLLMWRQRQEAERERQNAEHEAAERQRLEADRAARERQNSAIRQAPPGPPRFGVGTRLPPDVNYTHHVVHDYERHHLHPPHPGQIWIVYPPYFLLLDGATGQVLEEAPDTTAQPGLLSPLYNVGIAWSAAGAWATRTGPTLADAQAQALEACSAEGQACTDSGLSLSAGAPACYALVRSGTALFGAVETDSNTATAAAFQRCEAAGGTACALQTANCNDHP